jgi:hypothetical protein
VAGLVLTWPKPQLFLPLSHPHLQGILGQQLNPLLLAFSSHHLELNGHLEKPILRQKDLSVLISLSSLQL